MKMKWFQSKDPAWVLADKAGNVLGCVSKSRLGWEYYARTKGGKFLAQGGNERSLSKAKKLVEAAHKELGP
jgi:hypothetical protein